MSKINLGLLKASWRAAESGIHLMIEALPASSPNEPRHETKFIPYCPKSDLAISRGMFNSIIMF